MVNTFDQVAQVVAQRLSLLLQTAVLISDSSQTVVASQSFTRYDNSDPKNSDQTEFYSRYLRLPFYVEDQVGEVKIEQGLDSESLSPKYAQAFIDLVLSQAVQATHVDQQIHKNQIIVNLLQGQISEEKVALQQASLLDIDFTPPRAVILINATQSSSVSESTAVDPDYSSPHRSPRIIDSIVSFFNLPDDTICADLGGGQYAVLKASDSKNLRPWATPALAGADGVSSTWTNLDALKRAGNALLQRLRTETGLALNVGIGRYHPGILGLSRSYQDAQAALRLGRQFKGQNQVYCLDDLGIAAFACVADERTKVELALHLLSPLDNEPELLHTLRVFFAEDCALSATAKQLCIHRNTLTYRLEKTASLTGLDPRRFDEAVQIRLALLLQEFEGNCGG